jgi:hypothetical protein
LETVGAGFGETARPDDYPDKRVLRSLRDGGLKTAEIWRTVVAWNTWGRSGELSSRPLWPDKVAWVQDHPEEAVRNFRTYDDRLAAAGRKHLILFDALDRTADDWESLRPILRGLLEIILEFRSFRAIRAKAFVRPDMLDDPGVMNFRDASKVTAAKVELRWARADLYGLLFQGLGNAPGKGSAFRAGCGDLGSGAWVEANGVWQVPKALRENEDLQRRVFDAIAGKWMERDRRRGFPYTWLPNHLADAAEQVSPRSFLAAIRIAAENSRAYRDYALHSDGIKKGVREATQIRVEEVREDFFWVPGLMAPLKGLAVPCEFEEIEARWHNARVVENLKRQAGGGALLPRHIDDGLEGLKKDLLDLALFSLLRDGRINMPDVYRVGFGLGRKGGVKPIR